MRLVGPRTILPLLPTLVLACAAPSPGALDQSQDAIAPAGVAAEEAAAGPAANEPSQPETEAPDSAAREHSSAAPAPSSAPVRALDGGEADRSQSRLDIAVPSINGGLNRDIIRRIASSHTDDLRDCHGRALASVPGLAGQLSVELTLDSRGRVTNAALTGDAALNDRVGQCVVALAMGWTFPDAGGEGSFMLAIDFAID
jgi:hypothetical protein